MKRLAAVLSVCALVAGGCSSEQANQPEQKTLTVMAAASLTETFTTIAKNFEASHPGVKIELTFGASSTLSGQIASGAPADVFASAATKPMDSLEGKKLVGKPVTFTGNSLTIAVPAKNPAGIDSLDDLTRAKVAICQPEVPCGVGAAKVFEQAKLQIKPVTLESDVKSVLTKVSMGEVDAGLVYGTDVKAASDKVKEVTLPSGVEFTTKYPIATISSSKQGDLAKQFIAAVTSTEGQKVLTEAGFSSAQG